MHKSPSLSEPPNAGGTNSGYATPQTGRPASSLLGLLSRLSTVRSRSSTVSVAVPNQRASSIGSTSELSQNTAHHYTSTTHRGSEGENARDRLLSILASAKHRRLPAEHHSAIASARRSVSGPAYTTSAPPTTSTFAAVDAFAEAVGPYDPVSPQVYLQQLAKASSNSSQTAPSSEAISVKVKYLLALSQTLLVCEDVDPLQTWLAVADYAHALEPLDIRLGALEVLRVCIQLFVSADNPAYTLGKSTFQKAEFYASICNYGVELKECTQSEIRALTDALDALCRGGRDVSGLDGVVERVCDWAGERFKRRQAERDALRRDYFFARKSESDGLLALADWTVTPLQDPSYASVFVAWPIRSEDDADSHASAMRLITNMHKFSWSHLSAESIKFATGYLATEALATSNDYVVKIVLEHIDVMSRYGFVPVDLIESVVLLLARVTSTAGRSRILVFDADENKKPCNPRLQPISPELSDQARRIVRNLLKSPANQALRFLRAGTQPPRPKSVVSSAGSTPDRRDIQVVIGCLWCIRDALNEFRSTQAYRNGVDFFSDAINSVFLDSWPILIAMGLPYFYQNLVDALEWNSLDVTEQVLYMILDRLNQTSIETIEPTPTVTPAVSPGKPGNRNSSPVVPDTAALTMTRLPAAADIYDASHVPYDEWDLILDIIERSLRQMHSYEDEMEMVLPVDLSLAMGESNFRKAVETNQLNLKQVKAKSPCQTACKKRPSAFRLCSAL